MIATSYNSVAVGVTREEVDGWIVPTAQTKSVPATTTPAWWSVPDVGFFSFTVFGLVLAVLGVMLSRKRRAIVCIAAFSVHLLFLAIGYLLLLLDAH